MGLLDALRRSARLAPQSPENADGRSAAEAAKDRGNAFMAKGDHAQAAACYRQALGFDPDFAEAHNNLALALIETEQYAQAEAALERALELKQSLVQAHFNLELVSQQACSWRKRGTHVAAIQAALRRQDGPALPPFPLLAIPEVSPHDLLTANRRWAERHFPPAALPPPLAPRARIGPRRRLRVGYLSADFHEHATTHLLAGILEAHDAARCDIHGYSIGPDRQDAARRRVQKACRVFRDLRAMDDVGAARAIAADEIDILVDLKGHTQNCRPMINALRPAPVIVNWLGYPCTLGDRRLADYLIGDPVVTPAVHADRYAEVLALMPHCYQPNDRQRKIAPPVTRAQEGLPEDRFVFCCFNQSYKITPAAFDLWCRLLAAVPHSVLWLMEATELAMTNLRREAQARGVAAERLHFADHRPIDRHLARLQLADLALDTFPYTSHTTGSDALWAGVPLATRLGETFPGRVAASLLHAVGLPELVAEDDAAYFRLVVALGTSPERLAALRATLAARRLDAPLFDTGRFARDLEALYSRIWEHAGRGSSTPIA